MSPSEAAGRPVYLVTGATSGIGQAVARQLAVRGGRVLIVARDPERGEEARSEIARAVREAKARGVTPERPDPAGARGAAETPDPARLAAGSAEVLRADLSSQAELRSLAEEVRARTGRLDALVNNAGVFTRERRVTPDGLELQLAVNYVAPYTLSRLLLPLLRRSAPARIVNVASMEHRLGRVHFDDLQLASRYRGGTAYRQSKLAVVLFTRELARRTRGSGVTVNAVHPGVVYTGLVHAISPLARLVKGILKTPEQGARGPVYLATSPAVEDVSGAYFRMTRRSRPSRRARDPEKARRLWRVTEALAGLEDLPPADRERRAG